MARRSYQKRYTRKPDAKSQPLQRQAKPQHSRPFPSPAPAESAAPVNDAPVGYNALSVPIMPKLTVGAVGDKYEQEADAVASQVVQQLNSPVPAQSGIDEGEDALQRQSLQRVAGYGEEEEQDVQRKPIVQLKGASAGGAAPPGLEDSIQREQGRGQALADSIRQPMEGAFGADFGGVRVHTDNTADQLNQSIQAKAFTTGQDVFFRQGAYAPGSKGGQELLAHELTHVVQQTGGGIQVQGQFLRNRSLSISHSEPNAIQRYYALSKDNYELKEDKSKDARNPFTRMTDEIESDTKEMNAGMKKYLDKQPPLNVADDNTLAINALEGEPKEFYATTGVISSANSALESAGSPIELFSAGNKISVPTGKDEQKIDLVMVQPKLRKEDPPGKDDFVKMTDTICRDVAKQIMGGSISHGVLKGDKAAKIDTADGTKIGGTHELAESMTKKDLSPDEASTVLGKSRTKVKPGKDYGLAIHSGDDIDKRSEKIGVNQSAWAQVGQGYTTQTIFDEEEVPDPKDKTGDKKIKVSEGKDYTKGLDKAKKPEFLWGYHFGAVVAESTAQDDQILMENYQRNAEIKEAKAKLLEDLKKDFADKIKDLDLDSAKNDSEKIGMISAKVKREEVVTGNKAMTEYYALYSKMAAEFKKAWYFHMVGKKVGQSFHEHSASSGYFANPLTLVVGNYRVEQPQNILFDEASTDLKKVEKPKLAKLITEMKRATSQGLTPQITLTGYSKAGWFKTGKGAGENRAESVKKYLLGQGVPDKLITVKGVKGEGRKVEVTVKN